MVILERDEDIDFEFVVLVIKYWKNVVKIIEVITYRLDVTWKEMKRTCALCVCSYRTKTEYLIKKIEYA